MFFKSSSNKWMIHETICLLSIIDSLNECPNLLDQIHEEITPTTPFAKTSCHNKRSLFPNQSAAPRNKTIHPSSNPFTSIRSISTNLTLYPYTKCRLPPTLWTELESMAIIVFSRYSVHLESTHIEFKVKGGLGFLLNMF